MTFYRARVLIVLEATQRIAKTHVYSARDSNFFLQAYDYLECLT